jgi:hypothetical protein
MEDVGAATMPPAHAPFSAAEVITRPVVARPSTAASCGSPCSLYIADVAHEEDLVVHRETEQDREHHQRHEGHDRHRGLQADQRRRPLVAEDVGDDAFLERAVAQRPMPTRLVVASSMSIYGEREYGCEQHGRIALGPRGEEQLLARTWEMGCPDLP